MANRRVIVQRQRSRRRTVWVGWANSNQFQAQAIDNTTANVLLSEAALDHLRGATLIRSVGRVWWRGTAAGWGLMSWILSLQRLTGAGASPGLIADEEQDMVQPSVMQWGTFAGDSADAADSAPIDTAVMRKLTPFVALTFRSTQRVTAGQVWVSGKSLFLFS